MNTDRSFLTRDYLQNIIQDRLIIATTKTKDHTVRNSTYYYNYAHRITQDPYYCFTSGSSPSHWTFIVVGNGTKLL